MDEVAARHGLSGRGLVRLHLAIEEHLANVFHHGYPAGHQGAVTVRFLPETAALRIEIEDEGRPFNPMEAPEVDTSLPLDQKPIGGLGVHMMVKSVDQLEYFRVGTRNRLVMQNRFVDSGI